jgi:xanthine dehydrogenase accessory factor
MSVLATVAAMEQRGEPGALVVVVATSGHTPQVVGAKMLVRPDGTTEGTVGGGRVEQVVVDEALEVLATGLPRLVSHKLKAELAMCCGGQMDLYIEPVVATPRLILFGAGHVARPTAIVAALCGFRVLVVDDRPDWNSAERFAGAERWVLPHEDAFAQLTLGPMDYVVITTPNHDSDREILGRMAPSAAGYVGMIGSTRKVEKALRQLQAEGISPEHLARAHAPIGLDIAAETPEEIAVSIVGELIRHRRRPLSRKSTRGSEVSLRRESSAVANSFAGGAPPTPVNEDCA